MISRSSTEANVRRVKGRREPCLKTMRKDTVCLTRMGELMEGRTRPERDGGACVLVDAAIDWHYLSNSTGGSDSCWKSSRSLDANSVRRAKPVVRAGIGEM